MFLKAYKVKSNVLLKGSDTKRVRLRLETAFPHITPEEWHILLPLKGVSLLQIVTHADFRTNVYCIDKLPMFFETEDKLLVPTVYALWRVQMMPLLTTVPAVLPKLANGADLMLPGVIPLGIGMNVYGRFKKGQLVAINLTSNKAPIAVGVLLRSSEDMYMSGGRGAAVKILHLFGDKLWGHEPSLVQQVPNARPAVLTGDDFPALGADTHKAKPEQTTPENAKLNADVESMTTVAIPEVEKLKIAADNEEANEMDGAAALPTPTETEKATISTATQTTTVEDVVKNAFMAALKNHGKTLQLPLLTSNFYRLYLVPEAEQSIDMKKTKYKKFSNFLTAMSDEGFLVVREETKGVDKIVSINLNHPELVNFITDFKKPTVSAEGEATEQPLFHSELTEMYIVTDATAPFFTKLNYKRGEGVPVGQIKKIVREYINKHNLKVVDGVIKAYQLDETLERLCNNKQATLNNIVHNVTSKMEHSYQMCSVKDMSANKPLIQMSTATRSGNKKVTLVSNIECYGIIIPEFIRQCKQGAAASTTIVKLPNQNREQLQIQGNQIRFVYNLLTETYKVPAKCIIGLELAKKEGKKKKH